MEGTFPKCRQCNDGDLVPLSDFGAQSAAIHYKAWICTNPSCGFNLKIRSGDVYLNEPIGNGRFAKANSAASKWATVDLKAR